MLNNINDAVDLMTSVIDNSTRLSAYAQAREAGKTVHQASLIAREATVDYNLRGYWTKSLALWAPFQNVATQTGYRMFSAQRRTSIMRKAFLASMGLGFAAGLWNYAFGGNDKDGYAYFDKLPEWTRGKELGLFLGLSDSKGRPQPIYIPFPFNYSLPVVLGYATAGMISGTLKWSSYAALALKTFISSFSELGEQGLAWRDIAPEQVRKTRIIKPPGLDKVLDSPLQEQDHS